MLLQFLNTDTINNIVCVLLLSQPVPLRKRRIRGRKERRGREKRSLSGSQSLRNHLQNLVMWRLQQRNQSRQEEERMRRGALLNKRIR